MPSTWFAVHDRMDDSNNVSFFILNYFGMFRADSLDGIVGLDVSYHGFNRSYCGEGVSQETLNAYDTERANKLTKQEFQRITADEEDIEGNVKSGGVDRVE
jgi:hypothetical protein